MVERFPFLGDEAMAKEIFFFLTKNDWTKVLESLEKSLQLKYIQAKAYSSKEIKEYNSLVEYEEFGINKSGDHQTESFMVLEKNENVRIREVQQVDGGMKYFVDQMENEKSVVLWPGGMHTNKFFICGHMGTIHSDEKSKKIFNLFQSAIKKQCNTKVGRYYVGNDAKTIYNDVRFITINTNQSREYDLKI